MKTRKRAKPRTGGTACVAGKRCIAVYSYTVRDEDGERRELRLCAKHAADRMMADHVKFQEGRCRRCGTPNDLQWAHVLRRNYMAIRWDRENSMALCRADHLYWTHRPLEWEQWCRETGVPWDVLRERALTRPPMDPMQVISELSEGAPNGSA